MINIPRQIRLIGLTQRAYAKHVIDMLVPNSIVSFSDPKRTLDQNAKLWAMLADVRDHFKGRCDLKVEWWKCYFMDRCGHEVEFEIGPDGKAFPVGFSSSKMTVAQMSDLITFIIQWGDAHGVVWRERDRGGFQ